MLGCKPQIYEASVLSITVTWPVTVKGVKVCAQKACPIICQLAISND